MSVEHLAIVLHHSRASGTDKLVLIGVANHCGDGGAWPSIDTLARYANVTPRQVKRSIKALMGLGELERHLQAGGLAGWEDHTRPNRYDVLVTCPEWCDHTPQHRPRVGWAWDKTLREVVRVEQLPIEDLSTGDTPEVRDTATRRKQGVTPTTPGDTHDTPGGDTHDTQTIPITQPTRGLVTASTTDAVREQLHKASAVHRQRERGTS